jgi:hypothetical protein
MDMPGRDISHAVAAAGIGVAKSTKPPTADSIRHRSTDLKAVYVHDDREGPYLKATIRKRKEELLIHLRLPGGKEETWRLTHILIPLHPKIRLSFAQLYTAALDLVDKAQSYAKARSSVSPAGSIPVTTVWKSRILRSTIYLEHLLREAGGAATVEKLCKTVRFSRYVASVRIEAPGLDAFDVLLDTTSTERNLDCLAVVQLGKLHPETADLCRFLVDRYGGRWIA